MWARVVEFMLGCWLAVSPFIFRHASDATLLWSTDFLAAGSVMTLALLSYTATFRHAHLLTILIALLMIAAGRFGHSQPIPPGAQNHIAIGLLLLMFAIIPNHASRPPAGVQPRSASE